jgi:UDP-glucose 4-epimerase
MKVLITGGAGYIGSQFVRNCSAQEITPVILDNLSTGHSWAVAAERFHKEDLSDKDALVKVLRTEGPEAVVHFAASAYVGESVENPQKYFNNNYVNTLHLLDAMVECSVRYFILSSTCAVYGTPGTIPITEDTPKKPISPYGLTKHFIEETLQWYERAYGITYVSLRYFNAAGADPDAELGEVHDPETHLIPRVLENALGLREEIEIYGTDYPTPDGTCIRDYIHISDLAAAHYLAFEFLKREGKSGIFNLGNNTGYSVKDIIASAEEITGRKIRVKSSPRREGDPPILVADSMRARQALGWKPRYEEINTIISHAWHWIQKAQEKGYLGQ